MMLSAKVREENMRCAAGWRATFTACADRLVVVLVAMAAVLATAAATAHADFAIESFDAEVQRADSSLDTRAGGHPDSATVGFRITPSADDQFPAVNLKTIRVDLPAGFIGNPQAVPQCEREDLLNSYFLDGCSPDSQVGVIQVTQRNLGVEGDYFLPIYNMVPGKNDVADFAFQLVGVPVHMVGRVRSNGDFGIGVDVSNVSQSVPVIAVRVTFWGIPSDPSHDPQRSCDGTDFNLGCSSTAPRAALLTNPSVCGTKFDTNLALASWRDPNVVRTATSTTPVAAEGCELLRFDPTVKVNPTESRADAPTGLEVDIDVPQNADPDGLATPPLKRAVVTLPEGMTISPSSADGLEACSDDRLALDSTRDADCPLASKIGTVSLITPLLAEPMSGDIILRSPRPDELFRLVLVLRGPGVFLKLPGSVKPDEQSGRITTVFDNNPQLPFSSLKLRFKSGGRAPLATPPVCGPAGTQVELTAWGTAEVDASASSHNITDCTPAAFNPTFGAGTTTTTGGADTSFLLAFGRDDRNQFLRDVSIALPEGLVGRISAAVLCGEGQAAAGTCGEGSRIGSVIAGAGPGAQPFYLPGRAYITGPYRGAPFGLSIVVPAIAGPFDLGTVVVRAAINVDPVTSALTVVADPLPQILRGVPLRMRSVSMRIDRRQFMINPSSCKVRSITGSLGSALGTVAGVSSRFQPTNCQSLPYSPRLSIAIGRRGRTKRDVKAPLTVTLRQPVDQANSRVVDVVLPLSVNARLDALQNPCTPAQFERQQCPASSVIGTASAVTPVLRDPLRGTAYFVRSPLRRLPDIVVALRGQVSINLTGIVSIPDLRLRTRFAQIPDVPITKFTLRLTDGRNGPVGLVSNMCTADGRSPRADVTMIGHNGKLLRTFERLHVNGCGRRSSPPARARSPGRRAPTVSQRKAKRTR